MSAPFLFADKAVSPGEHYILDEASARHIHVLRMVSGDPLIITNGRGLRMDAAIIRSDKKHCEVKVLAAEQIPEPRSRVAIGVSFTKNTSRIEWFLEKATEIGISEIYPTVCQRTEKMHYRFARLQQILISAMLQSQQCHLPLLHEPVPLEQLLEKKDDHVRYVAHCEAEEKPPLQDVLVKGKDSLLIIGPEGDFTTAEIASAKSHGFLAVSLGPNRLRTETAAIVGCILLNTVRL